MQNEHFTPPQLANLFGVNVSTIKRWADREYLPTSTTVGGHRRISKEQLSTFINKYPKHAKSSYVLRKLLKKDFKIEKNYWQEYYSLLKKNENQKALAIIEKLYLSGASIIEILRTTITPTLREIGEQWSQGKISVYEEHRMSFNMRIHLMHLDQFIPNKTNDKSPSAIVACAPGEYHELPLQLVSLIFKLNGWKTYILGVNIKIGELIKVAKKLKPSGIVVSKTYTKKESNAFFDKLTKFADRENICVAFGGGAWQQKFKKAPWAKRKCAHYFPALKLFSDFLKDYKRKH
ncbi:MAG: helix-turn-helix domain-containing protein [bacterium]|nr:helix-turn-helix domain-containing protein [bacterium]